jgi:hypothetical protein
MMPRNTSRVFGVVLGGHVAETVTTRETYGGADHRRRLTCDQRSSVLPAPKPMISGGPAAGRQHDAAGQALDRK